MRAFVRSFRSVTLIAAPSVAAAPPLTPALLSTTPDKLLKVGTKGTPEVGWGKDGIATKTTEPEIDPQGNVLFRGP